MPDLEGSSLGIFQFDPILFWFSSYPVSNLYFQIANAILGRFPEDAGKVMNMTTTIMVLVTDMEDVFVNIFSLELNVINVRKRVHFLIVIQ